MSDQPDSSAPDLSDHIDPETDEFQAESGVESAPDRPWRLAEALKALLEQVNEAFPRRSKLSDGTIGDLAHRQRPSDHNPNIVDGGFGVVTALDITHDPAKGCDAGAIAEALRRSQDARIKYIISNRRIASSDAIGTVPAWTWRAYTKPNPHEKHVHVSVKATKAAYDDAGPWALPAAGAAVEMADGETGPAENEAAIRAALQALGASRKPLLATLLEAQEAIGVLLARHADDARAKAIDLDATEASAPTLGELRDGYRRLWAGCSINAAKAGEVAFHRRKILAGRASYEQVSAQTQAPWWFIGIVHALEASFNFNGHLHNGDPLGARTVQVPRGRPPQWNPPTDWVSSAVDAITFDGNAGVDIWSIEVALFRFERYNGFGYRSRGINSPYLWSFSNQYARGKFVKDGVFDPDAVSRQCGAAVMLKALVEAGDVDI
jgi:lysozyme family protein